MVLARCARTPNQPQTIGQSASTVLHNAQSVSVVRTPTQQAEDVIPFSRRHKSGATTILFSPDRTATARARLTRGNGGHHFAAAVGVAALKSGVRPIISIVAAEPANAGALYRARRRK